MADAVYQYNIENGRYIPNIFHTGDVVKSYKFPEFELPVDVLFPPEAGPY